MAPHPLRKGTDTIVGMAQAAVVGQQQAAITRTRTRSTRRRKTMLRGLVLQWSLGQKQVLLSMGETVIMGVRGVLGVVAGEGRGASMVGSLPLGGRE